MKRKTIIVLGFITVVAILMVILLIVKGMNEKSEDGEKLMKLEDISSVDIRFKLDTAHISNAESIKEIYKVVEECQLEESVDSYNKGWIYEVTFNAKGDDICRVYIIDDMTLRIGQKVYRVTESINIKKIDEISGIDRK